MSSDGKLAGTLAVTNSQASDVRLILEPWADEHLVSRGSTVEVSFSGPPGGRIQLEMKPGEIVIYGWEGALMSIVVQE